MAFCTLKIVLSNTGRTREKVYSNISSVRDKNLPTVKLKIKIDVIPNV
jgi:hypothetical protein